MSTICIGLLSDRHQADAAIEELRRLGISPEEIGIILAGRDGVGHLHAWEHQNHIQTPSGDDWQLSDVRRVGLAWLGFEVGSLTLPIAGYVIALGGLVAGCLGAAAALALATSQRHLAAALIDLGMEAKEARYHEKRIAEGAFLALVNCERC
jgi:hypothetical protein